MTYSPDDVRVILRQIDALKDEVARLKNSASEKARADANLAASRNKQIKLAVADDALNKQQAFAYADEVQDAYSYHGLEVPALQTGEHESNYRRRLLSNLQKYSEYFAGEDLYAQPQKNLEIMSKEILQSSLDPASYKVDVPPGTLRGIKKVTSTGNVEQRFVSSDGHTFFHEIAARWPKRYVKSDFANPPCLKFN
jgi:hypothetical protein